MVYKHKSILVTGRAGAVGRQLVRLLSDRSASVIVADWNPVDIPEGAELRKGDLTNRDFCQAAVKGTDYVFHLAAPQEGVTGSVGTASVKFANGLLMNTYMMEAARRAGVERYLFASDSGVYPPSTQALRETDAWSGLPHPVDGSFGWTKLMGELQAEAYSKEYGWDKVAVVRLANSYGPCEDSGRGEGQGVSALVRQAVEKQNPFLVPGSGEQARDLVYSEDMAKGMLLALEKYACCDPINICTGVPVYTKDLVRDILDLVGYTPKVVWASTKSLGEDVRVMDPTKMREKLGFYPGTSLREGLQRTIDWYEENHSVADTQKGVRRELV